MPSRASKHSKWSWVPLLSLVSLIPGVSHSYGDAPRRLYLGAGLITSGLNTAADSATGDLGLIGRQYLQLGIMTRFSFWESWAVAPSLHFTPLSRALEDSAGTSSVLMATLPLVHKLSVFDVKLGSGVSYQFLRGEGGIVELRDGNATDEFALPGRNESIRTLHLALGLGVGHDRIRFDLDAIVAGALSSRRTYSLVTQVSYGMF